MRIYCSLRRARRPPKDLVAVRVGVRECVPELDRETEGVSVRVCVGVNVTVRVSVTEALPVRVEVGVMDDVRECDVEMELVRDVDQEMVCVRVADLDQMLPCAAAEERRRATRARARRG